MQVALNPDVECPAVKPYRLVFVNLLEARRDSRFNRALAQNFSAKRVDCSYVRLFESCQRMFKVMAVLWVRSVQAGVVQVNPEPRLRREWKKG